MNQNVADRQTQLPLSETRRRDNKGKKELKLLKQAKEHAKSSHIQIKLIEIGYGLILIY